jgi:hypothetical protein
MESLWLRPGSGSAIPLDFLGPWPFCREDPAYEGLDFLGFSRQNRYFSMGYEAKSAAKFIARFFRDVEKRRSGSPRSWHMEAQDCSWGKLNLVSDFLQEIVIRAVPSRPPGDLCETMNCLAVNRVALDGLDEALI